jgi:hypothetical protein
MSWDMTKAQETVDQVLKVCPIMTSDKARTSLEMVYDDFVDDSEARQIDAVNAVLITVFGDPKHAKAQIADGKSLDIFLALLTDFRAEAWKKERRSARLARDAQAAKKAAEATGLIGDLKIRYAGAKKAQAQLEKEKADTILELQTLEASKTMMSERMSQANLEAKRSNEKVEELKTQVKGHREHTAVGLDGTKGQQIAMQADLDSFREQIQSQVDRMSHDVDSRLKEASKQQTDAMVQMSEQIARAVSAETTAQADRIEQMFGQMMAAQASSKLLLDKESKQDKEATPP